MDTHSYSIPFGGGVDIVRQPAQKSEDDIITVAVRVSKQRRTSDEGATELPVR